MSSNKLLIWSFGIWCEIFGFVVMTSSWMSQMFLFFLNVNWIFQNKYIPVPEFENFFFIIIILFFLFLFFFSVKNIVPIEFCAKKISFQLIGEQKFWQPAANTKGYIFFFQQTLFSFQFPGCKRRTQVKYFNALVLVFYNKHKKEISINY